MSYTGAKFINLIVGLAFLHICHHIVYSTNFNRNVTGVAFSAYVRSFEFLHPGQDHTLDWRRYSQDDVKTMLKVIAGKFSKVATFGVGASNTEYQENVTYHHGSYAQVYSAEAAATVNKEENSPVLSIAIGIWLSSNPQIMNTEVQLALESAQRANKIYPGTPWGLVFSENEIATSFPQARTALTQLQNVKAEAAKLNLKLGTRQNCNGLSNLVNRPLTETRREIVKLSDFIICVVDGSRFTFAGGQPSEIFEYLKNDLVAFKSKLKLLNPSIQVMGQTGFATVGNTQNEFSNLREYWKLVDGWATENNFTMWMLEAFDNPWKLWDQWAAHYGWWSLRNNDEVGSVEGYIEKVSKITGTTTTQKPRMPKTADGEGENVTLGNLSVNVWTYVAVAISLIVAVTVISLFALLYSRFRKLRGMVLSKDEVKQFLDGDRTDKSSIRILRNGTSGGVETEALSKPYDKSFEISKEKLNIVWDCPLGSGQFGCVFKAILILSRGGSIEVALKMAKSGASKDVVKSILSEIKILTHLGKHANLVSLQGAYTAEIHKGVVYVATELCDLGSLKNYLKNCQQINFRNSNDYGDCDKPKESGKSPHVSEYSGETCPIKVSEMMRWSHEIACGMEYLTVKHVVHADLATRNVLLTSNKTAKITDFGLSRRLYDYECYLKKRQEPLPWRWMSIEALRKLEFSSQSDVWSYGVTLWEIFSLGDVPYPGLSWTLDFVTKLENGLRMESPKYACEEIYEVMTACWEKEPHMRPSFPQLSVKMSDLLEYTK